MLDLTLSEIWLILAGIFVVLELLVSTIFFFWLALASLFVGILILIFEINWIWQLIIFSTLTLILIFINNKVFKKNMEVNEPQSPLQYLIGKTGKVISTTDEYTGRIEILDTEYQFESKEKVELNHIYSVVGIKDSILIIEIVKN